MAFAVKLFKRFVKINESIKNTYKPSGFSLQAKTLKKLLDTAKNTQFGKQYDFTQILKSKNKIKAYHQAVPIYDYDSLYKDWWHKTINGEEDVCWPGKVKYFALSSGTSGSPSKQIPVTKDTLRAMRKAAYKQSKSLVHYDLPEDFFEKNILMLGGTTNLTPINKALQGDLSGILMKNIPLWMYRFYRPGRKIANIPNWTEKLEEITLNAKDWDIGIIAGVPAWSQILIENIIKHYRLEHIHEIWPNFKFLVHGGVAFEPYRKSFEKLLGKEVYYMETYLASEGFMALQNGAYKKSMQLLLDNGIFFEFIPFNDANFNSDGSPKQNIVPLVINQVKENIDYAILISTCSGNWRYLIGDTIRFTSLKDFEIVITGRTKHFLSLCGEHLSVDNMNHAIQTVAEKFSIDIKEFTVAGFSKENYFAHHWYIGTNDGVDAEQIKLLLDQTLKKLNDDYAVERQSALKEIIVDVLPVATFYEWMKQRGKEGGQNKFPRVLKNKLYDDWQLFVESQLKMI